MPPLRYFAPNAFTAASLLLGLGSIATSVEGNFELAAWMILWGTLLDKLDGTVARLCKATSSFGVEFDSFADFVAFGIAPAALFFYRARAAGEVSAVLAVAAGVYVVALAVRLARFNVTTSGEKNFQGVPGTLMGAVLASGYLTWELYRLPESWLGLAPYVLVAAALLMVSSLRLPKLAMRKNKFFNLFQLGNVIAVYVCGPLRLFPQYLLGLALTYLVGGLIAGALPSREGKKVEAPEPELDGVPS